MLLLTILIIRQVKQNLPLQFLWNRAVIIRGA